MHSFSDFLTYLSDSWDGAHTHGDRIHRAIMRGLLVLFVIVGPVSILFAYIAAQGNEWARTVLAALIFVTSFTTLYALSSFRKITAVGLAGWAVGYPAPGPAQEFAVKSLKLYGNAVGFTLMVNCLFQLILYHFPQIVGNASGAFGVLVTSYALMLTVTFCYVRGMITEGPWHRYVIVAILCLLVLDIFLGLQKPISTIGAAGPKAADAAYVRGQTAKKAADEAQAACINGLPGNVTTERAIQICAQAGKPAPQAPRKLSALEQDAFTLNSLNQGALDAETTTCIQFLREIVEGYKDGDGAKVAGRSLKASDYESDVVDKEGKVLCNKGSLARVKKMQKDVERNAAASRSSGSQIPMIGGEPLTVIYFDIMDPSTYGPSIAKFGVLHLVGLAVIALFAWLFLKKKDGTTTSAKVTAKASTGNGWKTLAVLMFVGFISFYGWNNWGWDKIAKGAAIGASRGAGEAETPVWNKFLTRDFVKGHGTKAFVGSTEYDVVLDDNSRISLQQNGNEMYAMGQQEPCSEPAVTRLSDGTPLTAATCSGRWKVGGSAYGSSYGAWVGKLNATHNGMIRVAYLSYSTDPNRAPVEVWFR